MINETKREDSSPLDIKLTNHIEQTSKKIIIGEKEYTYKFLYDGFLNNSLNIDNCSYGYISCYYLQVNKDIFFFSTQLLDFKLTSLKDNTNIISQNICCSDEISILLKNYEKNKVIFKNKMYDSKNNFEIFYSKAKNIEFFYNDIELSVLNFNNKFQLLVLKSQFAPKDSSPYFYEYFPGNENQTKIVYIDSAQRTKLTYIISKFIFNPEVRLFKFTGPSGIGKSFSLFIISRSSYNRIYLNLKVLNNLKEDHKQIIKLKNILISELNRLTTCLSSKEKNKLKDIINNKFELEDLIINIINNLKKTTSLIILDQFKYKYFTNFNSIEDSLINTKSNNLKLIICSSVDDKIGRESIDFLSTLLISKDDTKIELSKMQKHFFYISELLETKEKELLFNNLINNDDKLLNYSLNKFNYVPKYVSRILNNKKESPVDEITEIKLRIKDKIKTYYNFNTEEELAFNLINLQKYMYIKFKINDLKYISSLFPLKYFVVKFYSNNKEEYFANEDNINEINSFDIEINFNFMIEILNDYKKDIQQEFFIQKYYKLHDGFTIGGYFEFIAIDKIKNGILKLPENSDISLRLKCICNMNEVDMEINDFSSNAKLKDLIFNKKDNSTKELLLDIDSNINYNVNFSSEEFKLYFDCEDEFEEEKEKFLRDNTVSIYYIENKKIINYIKVNTEQKKTKEIYLEVKDKEIYKNIKENNIIFTQSQQNAPVYDAGYLFGKSYKKKFIGFQMKSLRDTSNKTLQKINKKYVIENSIQLLFTSKLLFDVDIVEWHYIVVGILFDSENEIFEDEKKYSVQLQKHCEKNDIRFIYYNPFKKIFLDSDKNEIIDLLNNKSNLFNKSDNKPYFQFDIINIPIIKRENKPSHFINFLKNMYVDNKEFIDINDKNFYKNKIISFKNTICDILEIKSIKFKTTKKFDDSLNLPNPGKNLLFFFKKKSISNDQFSYYAFLRKNKKPELFTCEKKGETIVEEFEYLYFSHFNLNVEFYVFKWQN